MGKHLKQVAVEFYDFFLRVAREYTTSKADSGIGCTQ